MLMAGEGPRFSVLLPTHARADVIGYAIKSVLCQTETDFELLIVGDGAEPGTAEAVAAFDDPRIRWFDLPKGHGFGYANRNIALRQARGRYVAYMSDDDLLMPRHLSVLGKALDDGAMIACTRAIWISSDGIGCPFFNNLAIPDEAEIFKTRVNSMPAACFAYVRGALENPTPWPEDAEAAGDWILWRRIMDAHPHAPLCVLTNYSVLHFAARRRQSRSAGMPDVKVMLDVADQSQWWPTLLRPNIPTDVPEQAVWWSNITAPGGDAALRAAIACVTDRLAWILVQSFIHADWRKVNQIAPINFG